MMHNTCEDSLLATPIIIDLVILTELFERVTFAQNGTDKYERFHAILSLLSFLIKAPLVPASTPVVNALFAQRMAIVNFMRAMVGLDPENFMLFEHRTQDAGQGGAKIRKYEDLIIENNYTTENAD